MKDEILFTDVYKAGIESRKLFDLSREAVAENSGLTARTVRNIEKGQGFTRDTIIQYMAACGVQTVKIDFSKK
jgi:transcriptional regulator with XRE-family HTH domain